MEASEAEPRCGGCRWGDAREHRAGRGRSVLANDRRRPARRQVSARRGAAPVHPEGRWKAAATGHPDRERSRGPGGYADDFVGMGGTQAACAEAEQRVREVLARLGLELHPDKTRQIDLSRGRQGFDFLGCHLHKRMSGPIWEREHRRVYFLQRWPSQRSMQRVRQRVKERTGRNRNGVKDARVLIRALNPILRGWGNYFRTGNAHIKFVALDRYVVDRLYGFMLKRKGRNLRPGEASGWTRDHFESLGLCRLRGTIQYPGVPR